MASSFFFNGSLFSVPEVMSAVDDSGFAPSSLTVGNVLAILGSSAGGQPQTALSFGDPATALATLVSGPLCDAVVDAFSPSNQTNAGSKIIAVRVDEATPATANVLDGSAVTVIQLTTKQYGLLANQTKYKIQDGSTSGKAVTIQVGNTIATQDNVGRVAFTIQYAGGQSTATLTVSNSTVTLDAPSGTPVATIALASNPTVENVVDQINAVAGFSATATPGVGNTTALNGLDTASAVDVKTSLYSATANLQAIIDWINTNASQFVAAVRPATVGTLPADVGFTYLTGGSVSAPMTGDWTSALTMLQSQDVQWIVPLTGTTAIWAAVDAHVQFMSTVGRKERRAMVGPAAGVSKATVESYPITINSDRTSIVWPGYYKETAAGLTLYDSFFSAAKVAAGFAGLNPGDAMTGRSITVAGLEVQVADPTDTTELIQAGILCLRQSEDGFEVVRSISTWLSNNNFDKVEVSCGAAVDFVVKNVRTKVKPFVGGRNDPLALGRAINDTETVLLQLAIPEPAGPGVIVGDANSPPFKNISASISGDVLAISFQCSPVVPTNFVPVTIGLVPFAGTQATATTGQVLTS